MSQPKTVGPGHLAPLVPVGMPPSGLHLVGVARLPTFFFFPRPPLPLPDIVDEVVLVLCSVVVCLVGAIGRDHLEHFSFGGSLRFCQSSDRRSFASDRKIDGCVSRGRSMPHGMVARLFAAELRE